MDEINKYVDSIFKDIITSKETKKLKAQMRAGAKEKLEGLVLEGIPEPDAVSRVIAEMGTAEDLRQEFPAKNKVLNITAALFAVLLLISLPYAIYVTVNESTLMHGDTLVHLFVAPIFVTPFNYIALPFLALYIIGRISPDVNKLAIKSKPMRITALVISVSVIVLFYFSAASMFFDLIVLPVFLNTQTMYLIETGYPLIFIGVLLFYGIKSRT